MKISTKENPIYKEAKAKKYDWINKITGEIEVNKSIMYMSRIYNESHRRLRRCANGETKCKNTNWKIKSQAT